ncbi:hypothetical protein Tco_0775771 [Tanacetum coccineum]
MATLTRPDPARPLFPPPLTGGPVMVNGGLSPLTATVNRHYLMIGVRNYRWYEVAGMRQYEVAGCVSWQARWQRLANHSLIRVILLVSVRGRRVPERGQSAWDSC